MKRILFITRSGLCQNLFREVLSLVPGRTEMMAAETLSQIEAFRPEEKKFSLVVIDQNCLDGEGIPDSSGTVIGHPAVSSAKKILIHSYDRKPDPRLTSKITFEAVGIKPFLPEELASLIEKNLS